MNLSLQAFLVLSTGLLVLNCTGTAGDPCVMCGFFLATCTYTGLLLHQALNWRLDDDQ